MSGTSPAFPGLWDRNVRHSAVGLYRIYWTVIKFQKYGTFRIPRNWHGKPGQHWKNISEKGFQLPNLVSPIN